MKTKMMKKSVLALAMACLVGTSSLAVDTTSPVLGIPNPIVTYQTYDAAAEAAGFAPLYLTKGSGYTLNYISLISKDVADLGFTNSTNGANVRVRTALAATQKGTTDISGVYSVDWKTKRIDSTPVQVAKINAHSYAAHWEVGDYLFSAQAENISKSEFQSLLKDQLVDTSIHYYIFLKK